MTGVILDGKAVAEGIRAEVAREVKIRVESGKSIPGLALVMVGENPFSDVYVRMKQNACEEAGIRSYAHKMPTKASQQEVEDLIKTINDDESVHGILVQLPLPSGLDEERVLNAIRIEKDIDGCNPLNTGRLAQNGREPLFVSCSPAGVMHLLHATLPSLDGLHAVVLGRSNILGLPVSLLLIRSNATVTVCHSLTKDLPSIVRQADILVTAVGQPEMVRRDWVKPGAVVIDAGINRIEDIEAKRRYRLVGDVAYDEVIEVAGAITPVPGGVGPMSIAMLLKNTLRAARLSDK